MRSVEADGRSIDLAIARALEVLGAQRDDVHVDILEGSSPGLLGFGRRAARVRATMRGSIQDWLGYEAPVAQAAVAEPEVRDQNQRAAGRRAKGAKRGGEAARSESAGAASKSGEIEPAAVVQEIFRRLVVEVTLAESGQVEVPGEQRAENVPAPRLLSVVGKNVEGVLGRRGEVLEAIEYLVNRMLDHAHATQRVALDAPGYRARRRAALEDIVRRMAARARERKRPVSLDAMGPGDRRIVLELLKGEPGIVAKSSGQGFYRRPTLTADGGVRKGGRKQAR